MSARSALLEAAAAYLGPSEVEGGEEAQRLLLIRILWGL